MKFIVDQTLGKLTKWLRLLGFDVVQIRVTAQDVHTLPAPQRLSYILTRQTSWPATVSRPDLITLKADRPETQLAELCRRLRIPPETWEPLKRCSTCNRPLEALSSEQVEDKVPDYIRQKHRHFLVCPQCGRIFWEGSHQHQIKRRLKELQDQIKTL